MGQNSYLVSEHTGTITGATNVIELYPPICEQGTLAAPDDIEVVFTQNQESGGAGGAICTVNLDLTAVGLPIATDAFSIGPETWTWGATRTTPFTVAIGATTAACVANAVAAINADTALSLLATDASPNVQVEGAVSPGGVAEFGNRTGALAVGPNVGAVAGWDQINLDAGGGAGLVSGGPQFSIIERAAGRVRIQVRGLRAADSLTYRVRCRRLHPIGRQVVPTKVSGANDLVTTLGSLVVTSATGAFLVNAVRPNDFLTIHDPTDRACNGIFKIAAVTATDITLETVNCPNGMKATYAGGNIDFTVGPGQLVLDQDTGLAQVPFDLPSDDAHTAAVPATNVALPGLAIETAELADLAVTNAKIDNTTIMTTKLAFEPEVVPAIYGAGYFRLTGNATAVETVTIGTRVYVYTAGAGTGDPLEILPGGAGPWAAAASITALIAAVNADAVLGEANLGAGADGTSAMIGGLDATDIAIATTCVNGIVSGAITISGEAAADRTTGKQGHVVTAENVIKWAIGATEEVCIAILPNLGTAWTLSSFMVSSNTGVFKNYATMGFRILQLNAADYALLIRDVGAVCAADDTIKWEAEV